MIMKTAFIVLCLSAAAQAQSQSSDSSIMQALLSEVHQLRLAVERANTVGPRIQLVIERMKLQREQVVRVSTQLDAVRRELEHTQSEQSRFADGIRNMEADLGQTSDPLQRKKVGDQVRD